MKYLVAVAAAALLAGTAHAGNVVVHYHDSDLATDQAAGKFYNTLDDASRKACRTMEALNLEVRRVTNECRDRALDEAIAYLDNEFLWNHHGKSRETEVLITRDGTSESTQYARISLVKEPG